MSKDLYFRTPQCYDLANRLEKAVEDLQSQLGDKLRTLTQEYHELSEKMEQLDREFNQKKQTAQIQLDLDLRKDKKEALLRIADELGYAAITNDEHDALLEKLSDARAKYANELAEAKTEAVKNAQASANAQINAAKSKFEVETAQLQAENNTLKTRVEELKQSLQDAKNQLEVAMNNSVRIAEAARREPVVVQQGK